MIITIFILSFILLISLFINYNLLKKNEKCEDMIISYETYMKNFSTTISFIDVKLKEIDTKGTFASDDEVGFFFNNIKHFQEQLKDFKIKN